MACIVAIAPLWATMRISLRGESRYSPAELFIVGLSWLGATAVVGISGSRAGLVLLAVSIGLTGAIWLLTSGSPRRIFWSAVSFVSLMGLSVAFYFLGAWRALERFEGIGSEQSRVAVWREVSAAIPQYWPYGSGGETIVRAMRAHESTSSIDGTFINRAHNEFLGIALEHGAPGLIWLGLVSACVLYFMFFRVRKHVVLGDGLMARLKLRSTLLAILPIVLLLAHSVVDYPMRTAALGVVAVVLIAMIVLSKAHCEPPSKGRVKRPLNT
jgi:O-antigen ligase